MHARSIVYLLVWVVLAFASTSAFAGRDVRILIFGDDLTSNTGIQNPDDKLPALITAKLLKIGLFVNVENVSVDGETTSSALNRLPQILAKQADIVIVSLGNNDSLRQVDSEIVRNNLDQILSQLEGRFYVLFTGARARPSLGGEYALRFNEIYPNLAEHHKVIFYPFLLDGISGRTEYFQRDGLHPNEDGVLILANKITPIVEQMARHY